MPADRDANESNVERTTRRRAAGLAIQRHDRGDCSRPSKRVPRSSCVARASESRAQQRNADSIRINSISVDEHHPALIPPTRRRAYAQQAVIIARSNAENIRTATTRARTGAGGAHRSKRQHQPSWTGTCGMLRDPAEDERASGRHGRGSRTRRAPHTPSTCVDEMSAAAGLKGARRSAVLRVPRPRARREGEDGEGTPPPLSLAIGVDRKARRPGPPPGAAARSPSRR